MWPAKLRPTKPLDKTLLKPVERLLPWEAEPRELLFELSLEPLPEACKKRQLVPHRQKPRPKLRHTSVRVLMRESRLLRES